MKAIAAVYLALIVGLTGAILYGPSLLTGLAGRGEAPASDSPRMVEAVPAEDLGAVEVSASAARPADLPQVAADAAETDAAAALAAVVSAASAPEVAPEVAPGAPGAEGLVVRGGKASLGQTTAAILADLALVKDSAPEGDKALEAMSSAAIAGLRGARGQGGADRVETLETLVSAALREGRPDAEIDALVNEAARAGDVSVPAELVTPEGKVDTAILLASLVSEAQIAAGLAEKVDPSEVIAGGEGVEVHMVAQADGTSTEAQFYTVSPGDSLGSIARRFYGDAVLYSAIFDANRAILASPDRIQVGQRLMIPQI